MIGEPNGLTFRSLGTRKEQGLQIKHYVAFMITQESQKIVRFE